MEQTMVRVRGRMLPWVDFGGVGAGGAGAARQLRPRATFAPIADRLQGSARVMALDQHQLAARNPELVRALIIEDVGAVMRQPEVSNPVLDVRGWPRFAPTREVLAEAIHTDGVHYADYFLRSAVASEQGWRLLFDYDEMMAVQQHGLGDWWGDWQGSTCPALLLHGQRSTLLSTEMAHQMVRHRPRTQLVEFPDAGHWIHDEDPAGCAAAILDFFSTTSEPA